MLTDQKKKTIVNILSTQLDVEAAYLFGSQTKGNAQEKSDIDVGIIFSEQKDNLKRELELERQLSTLVGSDVDVRSLNLGQSPVFLMQAVQGELLIGYDRPKRVAFEVALAKAHDDAEQYFRIARHYL